LNNVLLLKTSLRARHHVLVPSPPFASISCPSSGDSAESLDLEEDFGLDVVLQ
jgi:hypothetical protein